MDDLPALLAELRALNAHLADLKIMLADVLGYRVLDPPGTTREGEEARDAR